jgi:septation ring formation regulator EzrA
MLYLIIVFLIIIVIMISQYIILKSHHTHPKLTALNESYESV